MTLLITYILIALGFSFLCSLLEATLLSVTSSSVIAAKQRGEKWAARMEKLKADVDKPLSAILTLNTVAHTMGAAGAGAQYNRIYGNATEAVFAGILTLAILVFTEIIPKTLGARYALFFARPTAWFLPILQWILAPLVYACGWITRLITFGRAHPKPMHREELLAVTHMGEKDGELRSEESEIVRNILQLHEVPVTGIMTPRSVIFSVPEETTLTEFADTIADKPFSRIPIYGENKDEMTGFVLRSEALLAKVQNPEGTQQISDLKRPIAITRDDVGVHKLFQRFLKEGDHIMLVANEFGTTVGLVTLEDILETIVGAEIVDEVD